MKIAPFKASVAAPLPLCNRSLRQHSIHKPHALMMMDRSTEGPSMWERCAVGALSLAQFVTVFTVGTPPLPALANTQDYTIEVRPAEGEEEEYFQTVPQGLSSQDETPKGPRLSTLLEGPRGKEVQQCTRKCVPTCIRGGQGGPGLGPASVRKEIVVFKEGYRSRDYCLRECVTACGLQTTKGGGK